MRAALERWQAHGIGDAIGDALPIFAFMSMIQSYRDLVVWQKSLQLIDEIDAVVDHFNSYQRWSLGMQMHRAAFSIVLNIAEGHDHDYSRVYLRNLADAKGRSEKWKPVSS